MPRFHRLAAGYLLTLLTGAFALAASPSSFAQNSTIFTENRGQIADAEGRPRADILFVARAGEQTLYFTRQGISSVVSRSERADGSIIDPEAMRSLAASGLEESMIARSFRSDLAFVGSNPTVRVQADDQVAGYSNYYLAHVPDGVLGVRSFRRVVYTGLYQGIDLVVARGATGVDCQFMVHDGANVADIALRHSGGELNLRDDGSLQIATPLGAFSGPAMHVRFDDGRQIAVRYQVAGTEVHLRPGGAYETPVTNAFSPAAQQPELWWATFCGGGSEDYADGMATDAAGNICVTGYSASADFPVSSGATQGTYAGSNGAYDAVVVKLDSSGQRQWATYYGGTGSDLGHGIGVDAEGNVLIGGVTGTGFPTTSGAFQETFGGGGADAFVVKLNAAGARQWATYYGGTGNDFGLAFSVDRNGNALLSGRTGNSSFPTSSGAFQSTLAGGFSDAFVVKLDKNGARQWATMYGGNDFDQSFGIGADASGNVVITGSTRSLDFPTSGGAFQGVHGDSADAFVVKFDPNGGRVWGTFVGGEMDDFGQDVTADPNGNVIVTGRTNSDSFPVSAGPFQAKYAGSNDLFIMKFDPNGARIWGTYYGGTGDDNANAVSTDAVGNILLTGSTASTDFPITPNKVQNINSGGNDVFVLVLNPDGTQQFATYYGGSANDQGFGAGFGPNNMILISGNTSSVNFPVSDEAFQGTKAGAADVNDLFMLKMAPKPQIGGTVEYTQPGNMQLSLAALSPNPADNRLQVGFSLQDRGSVSIRIYSTVGNVVGTPVSSRQYDAGQHRELIDVSTLPAGSYLLEVQGASGRGVQQFVVVR